jgi:hypothetical protein
MHDNGVDIYSQGQKKRWKFTMPQLEKLNRMAIALSRSTKKLMLDFNNRKQKIEDIVEELGKKSS